MTACRYAYDRITIVARKVHYTMSIHLNVPARKVHLLQYQQRIVRHKINAILFHIGSGNDPRRVIAHLVDPLAVLHRLAALFVCTAVGVLLSGATLTGSGTLACECTLTR